MAMPTRKASTSSFFCFPNYVAPPLQLHCETISQFRGGVGYKSPSTLVTAGRHLMGARNYAFPVRLLNARAKRKSGAEQCAPQRADQYWISAAAAPIIFIIWSINALNSNPQLLTLSPAPSSPPQRPKHWASSAQ